MLETSLFEMRLLKTSWYVTGNTYVKAIEWVLKLGWLPQVLKSFDGWTSQDSKKPPYCLVWM